MLSGCCTVAVHTHRMEDVNVNTASQHKGMCEARKKPWGQSPKDEGRGVEKEGRRGGGKMEQRRREWVKRELGEEEKKETQDGVRS